MNSQEHLASVQNLQGSDSQVSIRSVVLSDGKELKLQPLVKSTSNALSLRSLSSNSQVRILLFLPILVGALTGDVSLVVYPFTSPLVASPSLLTTSINPATAPYETC